MTIANAVGNTAVVASVAPDAIDQARSRTAGQVCPVATGTVVGVEFGYLAALTRWVIPGER